MSGSEKYHLPDGTEEECVTELRADRSKAKKSGNFVILEINNEL